MKWQTVDSLGELDNSGWDALENAVSRFEDSWRSGASPELGQFVPDGDASFRARSLIELIKVDIEYHIRNGRERLIESYLDAWPALQTSETTVELLEAECLSRAIFSTPPTPDELERRFGDLASLIDLDEIEIEAAEQRGALWDKAASPQSQDTAPTRRPTWRPLPIGYLVGRYEILSVIGAGGMAWVYRAHDHTLDRDIALKVPRFGDKDCLNRFVQEGQAAAAIEHPNVCRIYDAGEANGVSYITMALIDGDTLTERLEKGPFQPRQAVEIARKVAEALSAIHAVGIVHRDVKTSNVMIDRAGEPVLMDFGLARSEAQFARLSQTGSLSGTPIFMPPEQIRGKPTDPRSDLYSLGLVLYHMIAGRLPFTMENVIENPRNFTLPSPRTFQPVLDIDLEQICLKAIASKPKDRFQSAREMADALQRYLEGSPQVFRRQWTQRSRRIVTTCIIVSLIFLGFVVWLISQIPTTPVPELNVRWIDIDSVSGFCLSQDDRTLFVGSESHLQTADGKKQIENPVLAIDIATGGKKILSNFPSDYEENLEILHIHNGMVLSPDNKSLFTTNFYFKYITQIDLEGPTTGQRRDIDITTKPQDEGWRWAVSIAISADGKKLVVPMGQDEKPVDFEKQLGGFHNDQVAILEIDGHAPELVAEVLLPDQPSGREVGVRGDFAYIVTEPRTSRSPIMYEVRISPPYKIIRTLSFPPDGKLTSIVISNNLDRAFVADELRQEIHIVDLSTWKIIDSLKMKNSPPRALAIDRNETALAVLSTQARTLYIVDPRSGRIHARAVDLRQESTTVKFSHGGGQVFVASYSGMGGIGLIDLGDILDFDQIVFASDRGNQPSQIYRISLHDKKPIQITNNGVANASPCWSPDGQRIAFISHDSNRPTIHIIDRNGQNETTFLSTDLVSVDTALGPTGHLLDWSPDGRQIAFIQKDQTAICVVDCQSKKVSTVFDAKEDRDDERSRISNLYWAADGNLYFTYHEYTDYTNAELFYVNDTLGKAVGPITDIPGDGVCDGPSVTFDGRITAMIKRSLYGLNTSIFLVDREQRDSNRWRQLTPDWLSRAYYPQWFPDGRRLVFSAEVNGLYRLFITDTETGKMRLLSSNGWQDAASTDGLDQESGNWIDSQPDVWSGVALDF
ncbi:MAG: protein kinase [Pirellulales bacterium]|nr:protein kinase [Pirellulales bacterium]